MSCFFRLYICILLGLTNCLFAQDSKVQIIAFQGIPASHNKDENFRDLKNAGFTVNLQMYSNVDQVKRALDLCQKYGLKLIFSVPELITNPEVTISQVYNHPALLGYYITDEPGTKKFTDINSIVDKVNRLDKKNIPYINLYPNYATNEQLEASDYNNYIVTYLKKVNAKILSFDNYSIVNNSIRYDFYQNLEIIRANSLKFSKPFWAFACSVIHFNYKKPTLSGLKLQQFSNLLYGAKGLQYYTYWGVNDAFWKANNYGYAIVDENGRPTPTYNLVKEVNGQINRLSWIFSKSKVDSVFHVGDTIPIGTKRMNFLPSKFKEFKTLSNKALVSFMSNGNNKYIVIMNKNLNKFLPFNYQVFQGVSMIDNNTGKSRRLSGQKQLSKIPPGDILIFTYKN